MDKCPNCLCSYSSSFPITKSYDRCRLPLSLECGHCVCYNCLRRLSGIKTNSPNSATRFISCSLCQRQSSFSPRDVFNLIPMIDVYQLGLIQLERIKMDMNANKIKLSENILKDKFSTMNKLQPLQDINLKLSEVKIPQLQEIFEETSLQLGRTSNTIKLIERDSSSLKADTDLLILKVKHHFASLHCMLQGKERAVSKQVYSSLQNQLKILNDTEKLLLQYHTELASQIDEANLITKHSDTTIQNIFKACHTSVDWKTLFDNLINSLEKIQLNTTVNLNPEFSDKLKSPETSVISLLIDDQQSSLWSGLENVVQELAAHLAPNQEDVTLSPKSPVQEIHHQTHEVGNKLTGYISHLEPPEHIYLLLANASFGSLHLSLQDRENESTPPDFGLEIGQYCVARYSVDQLWYRGLVEKKQGNAFLVYFIDFGNRELRSIKFLRPLHESFYELPAQAIRCSLPRTSYNLLKAKQDQVITVEVEAVSTEHIGHLPTGQQFTLAVSLCSSDQPAPVVEDNSTNQSLRKKVVGKKPTPPKSIHREKKMASPLVLAPVPGGDENHHKMRVTLARFVSPAEFYVWTEDSRLVSLQLSNSLQSYFDSSQHSTDTFECGLEVGCLYAVEHSGTWYRCKLETLKSDEANVFLVDAGITLVVDGARLRRLEDRFLEEPFLAVRCSLWGLKPAGHVDRWSRTSHDKMEEVFKTASKLFIEIYHEIDGALFVRFYYEFVKPGGPLECDTNVTTCLNDELLELGLALRLMMPLSCNRLRHWLPCKAPPMEFDAVVSWVDQEGAIFLHLLNASSLADMETITKLLNSYLADSTATVEDHQWEKDQPCIFRCVKDQTWYRARVIEADSENKTAAVFLVDHGREEVQVAFDKMRPTLMGAEYPVQTVRCWMKRYPADQTALPEETEELRRLLLGKNCHVRVISSSGPVFKVDLELVGNQSVLDAFFDRHRPPVIGPVTADVADKLLQEKSVDVLINDVAGSDEDSDSSDLVDVHSNHEDEFSVVSGNGDVSPVFPALDYPLNVMLPVEIVSFLGDTHCVIQPCISDEPSAEFERDQLRGAWQRQTLAFRNMDDDLQIIAPHLPQCEMVDNGSSCVALHPSHNVWCRGIVKGYADDSLRNVLVELVDLGSLQVIDRIDVRQLPCEYSNLPRHSMTVRLVDQKKRLRQRNDQIYGFFQERGPEPEMKAFFMLEGVYSAF